MAGFPNGGGGSSVKSGTFSRTTGDLTLNSITWANLPTIGTSFDISLPASLNDMIAVSLSAVSDSAAVNIFFDAVSIVSGSVVNSLSTGAAPNNSDDGVAAWFMPTGISAPAGGILYYKVGPSDISGGNITIRLQYRGDGAVNRNLHATALFPLQFSASNLKQ